MAIPEAQLLESEAIDLTVEGPGAPGVARRGPLVPALLCLAGVACVVIAGWGIRSAGTVERSALAIAGGALLWQGLQWLGRLAWGPSFRLGLVVSVVWLTAIVLASIFASWLPIEHWREADIPNNLMRPGLRWPEPLGRTTNGYSELGHVIWGARTSLTIGVIAVGVGLFFGVVLGLLAGWYGKGVDATIGVLTNSVLAFPPLILLLAIVAVYGSGTRTLAFGLAALSVPTYTRLMRAQTIAIRQREFVLAARAMGATNRRLMWREILPNAVVPVAAYSFIIIGVTIVAEASLSFLGLGVPPPRPSWGSMIDAGRIKLKTDPHLVYVPAVFLFITVLSLNRIGEWARRKAFGERGEAI
ncbi:MAG TPA: ABC transporter permease [Acidimicrobiales bacterium]